MRDWILRVLWGLVVLLGLAAFGLIVLYAEFCGGHPHGLC